MSRVAGVKKLALGTVQLGLNYGVNNAIGRQPTEKEAHAVLEGAVAAGIEVFDTAAAYGNAERVLGSYRLSSKNVRIISKLRPDTADSVDAVIEEIRGSLERLGAKSVYGYMLHRASDMECPNIMRGLAVAKEMGLTEKIGVSIYEPDEALQAVSLGVDMVQIPYNALDFRLDECGFFAQAKNNKVEVYARSAFLQGLLLMSPAAAETRVKGSGALIAEFQRIVADCGFSPLEGAMLYSLSHPGIDYVVFGVDTAAQLAENIKIAAKLKNFGECYKKLYGAFKNVPREIIVPSLW